MPGDTLYFRPNFAPILLHVEPELGCPGKPVHLRIDWCDPCGSVNDLLKIDSLDFRLRLTTRVNADTTRPLDCPPDTCPMRTWFFDLGTFAPGAHEVRVLVENRVTFPDSTFFIARADRFAPFAVRESCDTTPPKPPPPPPPPGILPYVDEIRIGGRPPCDDSVKICAGQPIPVVIRGTFPDDCFILRRLDVIEPPYASPLPHPPIIRLLVDDRACLEIPCREGPIAWSASVTLPGLPARDWLLPVQLAKVSCSDSFPHDSTVHTALIPFVVTDSCGPHAQLCLVPAWKHPNAPNVCDDSLSARHDAQLTFGVRSRVALAGLQGELHIQRIFLLGGGTAAADSSGGPGPDSLWVKNLETMGPAAGMSLLWERTANGAKFVMVAVKGAPIPALRPDSLGDPVPVLRVTITEGAASRGPGTPTSFAFDPFGTIARVLADHLLGSDSLGIGVPECDLPCDDHRGAVAVICSGAPRTACDLNGDGVADVRDLVLLVHCIEGTGPCPDSTLADFDCNHDGHVDLDDALCCGSVILHGRMPDDDHEHGRDEPGISAKFGDPVRTAGGVDLPLELAGAGRIGAARLTLSFPADRFEISGVDLGGDAPGWLKLHERDAGQLLIGLIQLGGGPGLAHAAPGARSAAEKKGVVRAAAVTHAADEKVQLVIHFVLQPGAQPAGAVTLSGGDFSGPDGVALKVNLGQPEQMLAEEPLGLSAMQPNPFGRETHFAIRLARAASVELEVHDLVGRRVATLYRGTLAAGTRVFTWDGRDANQSRAANGVYFVRLVTDGKLSSRKVVLLRAN
ncbi:MAG: T9SS type A sorting domain-containing protein [Candidatus Eisenbacteria bacterium]|nr:T9SS type A sorting domain-containing protein [Candidatus Eisenbacteria bacterium]